MDRHAYDNFLYSVNAENMAGTLDSLLGFVYNHTILVMYQNKKFYLSAIENMLLNVA